ncbi:MAG: hypothetical protein K2X77_24735 [Candidatus Obscuribacterales bacterium]|jgi:hypothetical protein|nr:hypothetical protein [Candidatus Obscuribacterales bacterium]
MEISNIGPIKSLRAPANWKRAAARIAQGSRMDLPVVLLVPEDGKQVEIGIFYRGRLESEEDGTYFHNLLEQNASTSHAVALTPGQIKALSKILDLAGFNQYSFPSHLSGYNADFHLRTAQILVINNRSVLKVDGEFKADLKADAFYGSIFVDADNRGRKIYEIFLLAADKETYLRTLPLFKEVTDSIEWQQLEKTTFF